MTSDADSSGLSSPPSEIEAPNTVIPKTLRLKNGKLTAVSLDAATPLSLTPPDSPDHETTPAHEFVLADNPDIPLLVAFRARFADVFPKNHNSFGPQDIERGIIEPIPSEQVELLLCDLLNLVLNRKKHIERGHHGRALEEALQTQRYQWPTRWNDKSPIQGGKTFQSMDPISRLDLLKVLMLWCLSTSEAISTVIKESYKQQRHDDDLNQPLSVQPWGQDGRKRTYWLIEGHKDTCFRLYMESSTRQAKSAWWSIAGSLEELKAVAADLRTEGSYAARRLSEKVESALPRLEVTEEKRRRREYRQARRAAFLRPEPGFSLYEGRTRGKRMKYTYSDDEEDNWDFESLIKDQSGTSPPGGTGAYTKTASGRHVRSRYGRYYTGSQDPHARTVPNSENRTAGRLRSNSHLYQADDASSEYDGNNNEDDDIYDHIRADREGSSEVGWEVNETDDDHVDTDDSDDDHDIDSSHHENTSGSVIDELNSEHFKDHQSRPKSLVVHLKYPSMLIEEDLEVRGRTDKVSIAHRSISHCSTDTDTDAPPPTTSYQNSAKTLQTKSTSQAPTTPQTDRDELKHEGVGEASSPQADVLEISLQGPSNLQPLSSIQPKITQAVGSFSGFT